MTRTVSQQAPPPRGAYAVGGPQRTDAIAGSLRRAFTNERALPADMTRLLNSLDAGH